MAEAYWESRHRESSIQTATLGLGREWRWKIINRYAGRIDDVIDVGCGDTKFWFGRDCEAYTGIDISESVVARNRLERPNWKFIVSDCSKPLPLRARIVLCMELLYHILDEKRFLDALDNLASYTSEWLFISTWGTNRFVSLRDVGLRTIGRLTQRTGLMKGARAWGEFVEA